MSVTETGDIGGSVAQFIKQGLEELKIEEESLTRELFDNISSDSEKQGILAEALNRSREARRAFKR